MIAISPVPSGRRRVREPSHCSRVSAKRTMASAASVTREQPRASCLGTGDRGRASIAQGRPYHVAGTSRATR